VLRPWLHGNVSAGILAAQFGRTIVTDAALKELREPLSLVCAEPNDSARLPPWFLQRIAHISDDRLSRRLLKALERSPSLPGRFQARGRMLCTYDQLWITHRAIPLRK